MGGTLALGSAAVGTFVPVTAPVAAAGVTIGLSASTVGGIGSVVGGAAVWVGGMMSGNLRVANYGFLTTAVDAVLAKADARMDSIGNPTGSRYGGWHGDHSSSRRVIRFGCPRVPE